MTNLEKYYQACQDLAEEVSKKYADGEVYWIGDRTGGIAEIGDAFLDIDSIAMVAEVNPTVDRFWDAYWAYTEEEIDASLANLMKYGVKKMKKAVKKK